MENQLEETIAMLESMGFQRTQIDAAVKGTNSTNIEVEKASLTLGAYHLSGKCLKLGDRATQTFRWWRFHFQDGQ